MTAPTESLADFHAARERSIRAPRGPLALVNSQTVTTGPVRVWPVPGEWAPAPGGLTVTAPESDGIVVDGIPVDGTVVAAGDAAVVPSTIGFADGKAGTIGTVPEGQALRIWDPAAESIARFASIGMFPESADWVLQGTYSPLTDASAPDASAPDATPTDATPTDANAVEARGTVVDAAGVPLMVAGRITVTIAGHDADLVVVRAPEFRGSPRLQLIFQDATSGDTTYSMGRFLFLEDPGAAGPVELDLNRAVLPPCAFSYQFACPIPPEDNRLPVAVTAGETRGHDVEGNAIH